VGESALEKLVPRAFVAGGFRPALCSSRSARAVEHVSFCHSCVRVIPLSFVAIVHGTHVVQSTGGFSAW
jgi:hypothetical protein